MDARIVDGRKIARVTDDGKLKVLVHGRDGDDLVPVKVSEDGYLMLATDVTVEGVTVDLGTVELNQGAPGQNPWPVTLSGNVVPDEQALPVRLMGHYEGLSTDAKPTLGPDDRGSFFEWDTQTVFYWDGSNWQESPGPFRPLLSRGQGATLVVAAHDASNKSRRLANYVCDGIDDEVEIQSALDSLPEGGGSVLLTEGTFMLSDGVRVPSKCTLMGSGWSTTLRLAEDASMTPVVSTVSSNNVGAVVANKTHTGDADTGITIRDLSIEGNSEGQSNKNQHLAGIYLENCRDSQIINVRVYDILYNPGGVNDAWRSYCVLTQNANNIRIIGGHFERAGYECIGFRTATKNPIIQGATIRDGFRHGIQLVGNWGAIGTPDWNINARIADCDIEGATVEAHGITLHGASGCNISNCRIRGVAPAIKIFDNSRNVRVSNCDLLSEASPCVQVFDSVHANPSLDPSGDVHLANCRIETSHASSSYCHGVEIKADDVSVIGGVVISSSGRGVNLEGATNVIIQGVEVLAATSGIYADANTSNCHIEGNTVTGANFGLNGSSATNCRVVNNDVSGITEASRRVFFTRANGNVVTGNIGHITENWGQTTDTTDADGEFTIAHGLASTPEYASVNVIGDTENHADVVSVDETSITVRIKDSSGSDVGSTQVAVYWEARL